MIYYVIYLILILSAVFEAFGSKNISVLGTKGVNTKRAMKYSLSSGCFLVAAVYLFLIVSLRYQTVGRDIGSYIRLFNAIDHYDFSSVSMETGYAYLNLFFHNVFGSFYLMFFVIALFCSFAYDGHIKKHSLFPCFILLLYVHHRFLDEQVAQTRQWIAMSIICLGYKFIKEKSFIKWTLLIILAMQFHITAICAFPLYFTTRITIKPWFAFLFFVFNIWMTLFGLHLVRLILNFMFALGFLPARIIMLLDRYLNSTYFGQQGEFGTGLGYLFNIVCNGYIIFLYSFTPKEDRSKMFMLNYFVGILLDSMGRNFGEFARIANYYWQPRKTTYFCQKLLQQPKD